MGWMLSFSKPINEDVPNTEAVYRVVKEEMEEKSKLHVGIANRIINPLYTHFKVM